MDNEARIAELEAIIQELLHQIPEWKPIMQGWGVCECCGVDYMIGDKTNPSNGKHRDWCAYAKAKEILKKH